LNYMDNFVKDISGQKKEKKKKVICQNNAIVTRELEREHAIQ